MKTLVNKLKVPKNPELVGELYEKEYQFQLLAIRLSHPKFEHLHGQILEGELPSDYLKRMENAPLKEKIIILNEAINLYKFFMNSSNRLYYH